MRVDLPVSLASLDDLTRFLSEFSRAAELDETIAYKVRLVAEELASNIVNHGYGHDVPPPPHSTFQVEAGSDDEQVWLSLVDAAPSFDPTAAVEVDVGSPLSERPVGGLGIHLVRSSVDRFTYARVDGTNRTTFMLRKHPG